jgi:SAM-dependent methyltransferase
MIESALQAQIKAARAYESLFVPALFGQWAPKVADAAELRRGERVLDIACGTGILAREVLLRVGSGGHVVGVDPNPGMLAVAEQLAPAIEWREGVAEALPLPDQSVDAIVSQFGLMFFAGRRQALRQMLRVLRPGGRLVIAVWDSLDRMPAYASEVALLEEIAGSPAADAVRAPFSLGNRKDLTALLLEAGIGAAEIRTVPGVARFPSIRTMVEADLRGWLPTAGVDLGEDQIARILQEAEQVLKPYAMPDGRVTFDLSAHLVTEKREMAPLGTARA